MIVYTETFYAPLAVFAHVTKNPGKAFERVTAHYTPYNPLFLHHSMTMTAWILTTSIVTVCVAYTDRNKPFNNVTLEYIEQCVDE